MNKYTVLLSLFIIYSMPVFSDQKIDWLKFDYEPVYMQDNNSQVGLGDQVYNSLSNCLSQYNHNPHISMTISRIFKKLNNNKAVQCLPALGSFPGQFDNLLYSAPVFTIPGSIVVVRKEDVAKFSDDGRHTSFKKLYSNETIHGAGVKDGTYGEAVQAILATNSPSFFSRSLPSPEGFYKMLLKNRFDYVLDYPIGYQHHSQKLDSEQQSKISYLLLTENSDKTNITAYALCSNSEQAQLVVEAINQCLSMPQYQDEIISVLLNYLPVELRAKFKLLNYNRIGFN
ncbi:MAG: hypothetical protein GY951_02530 [Psychromonas sp.]|nr:hypothetical protein [Psychromonas sp.]